MIDLLFMSSIYKTAEETESYKKEVVAALIKDGKVDCTQAHAKRKSLCQTGGFRPVLKHQLIAMLVEKYNTDYFVETGTYMGETTTGVSPLFKHCYTIEASELYFSFAAFRLAAPLRENISVFHGESQAELPGVLDLIKEQGPSANNRDNIIFFLDAHFSGGTDKITTFKSQNGPCPTLKELEVIRDSGLNQSIIIVDDFSSFGVSEGYPSSDEILKVIKQINPDYKAVYIPEADCLKVSLDSGIGGSL